MKSEGRGFAGICERQGHTAWCWWLETTPLIFNNKILFFSKLYLDHLISELQKKENNPSTSLHLPSQASAITITMKCGSDFFWFFSWIHYENTVREKLAWLKTNKWQKVAEYTDLETWNGAKTNTVVDFLWGNHLQSLEKVKTVKTLMGKKTNRLKNN